MFTLTRSQLVLGFCSTLLMTVATGAEAQVRDTIKRRATPPARGTEVRVAARTAPASAAEINALHASFRSALSAPAVRAAAKAEIRRQLRNTRPIALVDGAWATPINLGALYGHSSIRPAVAAKAAGRVSAERTNVLLAGNLIGAVGIVLTPTQLGNDLLGHMAGDLMASMAEDALKANMTGGMSGDQNFFIAILPGIIQLFKDFWNWMSGGDDDVAPDPTAPTSDPDGDGLANKDDADDDGDGTPDDEDNYPYDPSASICHDCQTGLQGISFTQTAASQVLKVVLNAHSTAVNAARSKTGIRLGTLSAGQRALNLGAAFAPGIQ